MPMQGKKSFAHSDLEEEKPPAINARCCQRMDLAEMQCPCKVKKRFAHSGLEEEKTKDLEQWNAGTNVPGEAEKLNYKKDTIRNSIFYVCGILEQNYQIANLWGSPFPIWFQSPIAGQRYIVTDLNWKLPGTPLPYLTKLK